MGFDASVILVFGVKIPLDMNLADLFPDINPEELQDISLPIAIDADEKYTLQSYTNYGEDYCVFVQLKTYELCVLRTSSPSPMLVDAPTPQEDTLFQNFLKLKNLNLPYATYMVIQSG